MLCVMVSRLPSQVNLLQMEREIEVQYFSLLHFLSPSRETGLFESKYARTLLVLRGYTTVMEPKTSYRHR